MFTEKDWVPFTHEELGIEKEEEIASAPEGLKGDFILPDGTRVKGEDSKYLFQEPPTFGEFTSKMIGAGVDQVQGLGMGVVGLAGDLAGSETVKQIGLEGFQRNMQEAAQAREDVGMVDFDEIDGVGNAGKWAYGTLLEQLPQLLPTIGLGGAGGIVGKQLVKKGLQEVIETGVASGLTREAAEAAVANAVATRGGAKAFLTGAVDKAAAGQLMRGGLTREATEQSLGKIAAGKLAPQVGVAAGNIAAGQAMSMGSIYGETEDAGLAVGYGAAAGAVEGLADTVLFSPFTKRAFGVDVAERVAKNRSLPKGIAKGVAKGVAVEGPLEEYPQTYIEQMARAEADPTFDINSEEAKRERLNAMAAGSVVGGTIGPVGGALEALAPRTKEALNRFIQKPLTDAETGLPAEPQGPPPAREYDQEAVTLEDGTVMRRFKIAGTSQEGWAVENASEEVRGKIAKGGYMDDDKIILAPGFTNSATLIQRAEDARAKALGKIDDKEVDEKATPKSLTPFLFDDSGTEVEPDPNADVIKDFGIATPPVKFKPAPEALGRRVRYEGYEGVLAQDGERYKLRVDDKTDVELPANAEVETAAPVPVSPLRGDTALTTTVRADESSDLVKDFGIKSQDGQTAKSPGSYPGAEGSTPSPATPDIDAINEIAKATLDLEPVGIVDALEEVSKTEALDDNAISLLDDAQRALEDGITQIESRDLSPDAKKKATDSLYAKLDQVDRIQQRFVPDKEPSTKLPPAPLEKELEAAQAEYERKLAEQQQATKQATEDRTPEETQAFVAGLPLGAKVIVDLDGNDIVGTVEGRTDEGAVIVRDKKTKKASVVSPAMQDRVALAPEELAVPTLVRVIQNALGVKPTAKTLTSLGFTPTEEVISEKVESTVHTESPVYTFKAPKDRVDQRPLDLRATFYKDKKTGETVPNLFYEHTNDTTNQPQTQVRNMLRAMDRGYEVRISNNVEAPLGVQTTPVEGTNYRVVTAIQDFRWNGAKIGSFVWGDRGLRDIESGAEGKGTFSDLWQNNPAILAQRGERSQQINQTLKERGTDATSKSIKRVEGVNAIGQAIFDAVYETYDARVNETVGRDFKYASSDTILAFTNGATNKLLNAVGKAGLNEDLGAIDMDLVQRTIRGYLERQKTGETGAGGRLTQPEINVLKKELVGSGTAKTPEAKIVNTTLNALQKLALYSNPKTQGNTLVQPKADAFRQAAIKPKQSVSLDAKVGDGTTTLGDLTEQEDMLPPDEAAMLAEEQAKNLPAYQSTSKSVAEEEREAAQRRVEKAKASEVSPQPKTKEQLIGGLTPDEKFAYDFLNESDWDKKEEMRQAYESGALESALAAIPDPESLPDPESISYENFPEDSPEWQQGLADYQAAVAARADATRQRNLATSRIQEKTDNLIGSVYSKLREIGETPKSPATRRPEAGAQGLEGGTLNRTSTTESVRRIKRRFLQARAGLTDEQIVAMGDDEIDRAFLAFNSRADESKAAKAQDAVVSVAPGIEDLLTRSSGELLAGYAEQVREAAEAGDMGAVRDANFAELVRLGAFASTREFLTRVSDPKNGLPRDMQLRAKAFLGLEKRGFKLDAIEIQAANFLKTGTPDRASWAGLLGRSADYKSFGIYLNLDQAHDRNTAQTILHELGHIPVMLKKHGVIKTTPEEKQALADLESMRRRAILRAGDASPTIKAEAEAKGITDPRDRTAFYETRLRELSSTDPEFRDYNGLTRDEFEVEIIGSPEFLDLLRRLGFGGADKQQAGKLASIAGMIRDAFKAILKLVAPGISASSEIGKAFIDSWNLTYAGSKPVVKAGELLQAIRGITEVKEAAPVPKKGTKKKSSAVDKKSTTVDAAAPQGGPKGPKGPKGPTEVDAAAPQGSPKGPKGPESNNQATATEETKRGRGRPTKREMREATALPTSKEAFEAEMESEDGLTAEDRAYIEKVRALEEKGVKDAEGLTEAELGELTQSPAAKPRVVKAALTDDERDLAERRASNMEDILFYNGITEQQYYTLVGEGILTPKEIEAGYMQNVPQMLSNISGDESQPGPLRHVAQMLLDLGFDFSKVRFRVAETADTQAEGGWAGLYEPGTSVRGGRISINMDSAHRGGVAQSIVHEALHHVFYWKTQKGYPLNRVERAAFNDLQKIFKQAERAALGRYARGGETIGQARARLAPGDLFYGLTNVDEFITEVLTNPEFQVFLQEVPPMQGLPKKGGYIRNLLDQIFSYLRDFVYGRDVSGDSLLTQGLDNVLALIQTPQTESGVQRAVNQMLGEPKARATMSPAGKIDNAGELNMALEMDRERIFKLLGERMYNADLSNVVIKETVQNSFDAIKDAEATGVIKPGEGKIAYSSERDNGVVKMSFLDNGIGMTPEILQKAFFTVGGSYKVSGKGSGGFGLAKVGMFMSADKVYVETVRDGVLTTADLTKEDLMGSGFKVKTEKTNRKNGTLVQLSFPEKWATSDGKEKEFESPSLSIDKLIRHDLQYFEDRYGWDKGDFQDIVKNFRGEKEDLKWVTFSNLNSVDAIFKGLPKNIPVIQKEFQIDNISLKISAARLGFKDPDGTTKYRQEFKINGTEYTFENSSMVVLSNGLFQFSKDRLVIDPMGSLWDAENKLPYSIVVDVDAGNIEATSTEYPFENNRESLRKGKVEFAINSFLGELQAKEKLDAFDNEFKALSGFDGSAPNKDKANFYNNISHKPDEKEMALLKDLSQEIFDSANSFVRELRIAAEAGLLSDSENWSKVKLKNDLTSEGPIDYYYGVGLSKNWGGVNTSREPTVVLVNPVYHPKTLERLQSEFGRKLQANHLAHIVAHEVNHALHRNEGAGFTWGLNDTESLISATDSYQESKIRFLRIIEKHTDAFRTLKQNYDQSETLNADQELTGSNSRTSKDIPANERLNRNLLGSRDLSNEYQSEVSERSAAIGSERSSETDSGGQLQRGLQTSGSSNQISLGEALISGRVAAPMSPAGDLMPAPMSPAGDAMKFLAKVTGTEGVRTFTGGEYKPAGLLSPDGKLPEQIGDAWRKSRQEIAAVARRVETSAYRLNKAIKAERKAGREVSTDLMNTALGSLDNPLTKGQRAEINALRAEASEAKGKQREALEQEANELEGSYMAKNREDFRDKQAKALAQLPANVAEAISEMAEHRTELQTILKKSGAVDSKIAATIDATLGIYLHRSYEIFDNPKYAEEVRKNEKVMQAAQNLIRRQIESRNADKLIAQTAEAGGILPRAEALKQARGTAKQEEIEKTIDDLLAVGEDSLGGVILKGRIPGQKDLSIFDSRGNISPEIQALWGRYDDPNVNYGKTVMKMATLVANHQFLSDLRSMGLKEGWLYNGPEEDRPRGYLKISSDNNKSLDPLSGLYGNRMLVEALYEMYPQNAVSDNYAWVRFLSKITGWSMAAKTVLSPVAQVRNNFGNILFGVAAGDFGFSDISKIKQRAGTAFDLSFRAAFNAYPSDAAFRKKMMGNLQDAVRRGVVGESLVTNLIGQLVEAKNASGNADQFLKKVWDVAQKTYSSSDDFWKMMGYLSEIDKYTKAMPEWTSEQVKDRAAQIVRDIRPTYSLSPAVLAKVKAFPFVAPFITFTTEVIRTTLNLAKLARYEIAEGNRTGNKELAAIGWKRVRGMGLAAFGPAAAASAIGALSGISGDDDDDLRRFLPDWQKNSQLLVFKNKDGKVSFVDVSYLDPYDYWKKSFGAFWRSLTANDEATATERMTKGAMEAAGELLRPFMSEQLVSGAVTDLLRNKDSSGRQIFNPQDTGANIAAKSAERLWKAFTPGAFDTGDRLLKAATGNVSDSGRAYNLGNEALGALLGQRVSELNVEQALGFKASKYARDIRDASSLFTQEFNSKGTRSEQQIMDAYNRANAATYELGKDFREDMLSAIRLGGLSQKQADEILRASRLGQEDIKMLRTGRYLRYEPSKQVIKLAKSFGNQDRIQAARRAESATPKAVGM